MNQLDLQNPIGHLRLAYQERVEKGMGGEAEEAEDQVGDVVPHFGISTDLPVLSRKSPRIAHDAQQVNPLQHHLHQHQQTIISLWN